ncbi:MAG TPA: Uma2 family endonuclease [Hyphomicrobiaceae bacterium]|nr:Uma2 family endonuclease [Hyphomicrobiaceae bacterium]
MHCSAQRTSEEGRFDFSRGRVSCDIIDASGPHGRVAKNIVLELGRWLDQDRFDINFANFAVRTPSGVRSPDVVVDAMSPRRDLSTSTPVVIAEVLTPSTAGKDFAEKLEGYTAVDTLQTYLIWSRYEPRAWVWARGADRSWPKHPFELPGRNGTVALGGLGVELPIAAIFRGIPDAPTIE